MLDSAAGAVDGGERRAPGPPSERTQSARRTVSWWRPGVGRRRLPWAGIWVVGCGVRLRGQRQGKPAPAKRQSTGRWPRAQRCQAATLPPLLGGLLRFPLYPVELGKDEGTICYWVYFKLHESLPKLSCLKLETSELLLMTKFELVIFHCHPTGWEFIGAIWLVT